MMYSDIHKMEYIQKAEATERREWPTVWREWDKKACHGPDGQGGESNAGMSTDTEA